MWNDPYFDNLQNVDPVYRPLLDHMEPVEKKKGLDHCCGLLKCKWRGPLSEAKVAPHPFQEGKVVYGCPECGTIGVFVACQEPGCTWPGETMAGPGERLCEGPFYCEFHGEQHKKR